MLLAPYISVQIRSSSGHPFGHRKPPKYSELLGELRCNNSWSFLFIMIAHTIMSCILEYLECDGRAMKHVWGEKRCMQVFGGKTWGKESLGRPRCRWEDNIKMDLQEVECGVMDWIDLAQYRGRWRTLVNAGKNLRAPWIAGNLLTGWKLCSVERNVLQYVLLLPIWILIIS